MYPKELLFNNIP